jgi:hypothetical protein
MFDHKLHGFSIELKITAQRCGQRDNDDASIRRRGGTGSVSDLSFDQEVV